MDVWLLYVQHGKNDENHFEYTHLEGIYSTRELAEEAFRKFLQRKAFLEIKINFYKDIFEKFKFSEIPGLTEEEVEKKSMEYSELTKEEIEEYESGSIPRFIKKYKVK